MLVCDIGYLAWAGGILLVLHFLNLVCTSFTVGCLEGVCVLCISKICSRACCLRVIRVACMLGCAVLWLRIFRLSFNLF